MAEGDGAAAVDVSLIKRESTIESSHSVTPHGLAAAAGSESTPVLGGNNGGAYNILFILVDQERYFPPGALPARSTRWRRASPRTWQRPPLERELEAQLDELVREEIATREAIALGLERDDSMIRRRLRQRFEFMAEDALDAAPPTDAELQASNWTAPTKTTVEARRCSAPALFFGATTMAAPMPVFARVRATMHGADRSVREDDRVPKQSAAPRGKRTAGPEIAQIVASTVACSDRRMVPNQNRGVSR